MSFGNRGMAFERLIDLANQMYERKGIAVINKRPTPMKVIGKSKSPRKPCVFDKKSTVDYDGVYKGKPIMFEAKSTRETNRFDLRNIHSHQLEYLEKCHHHGAISFILVEFEKHQSVYLMPYQTLIHYHKLSMSGKRGTKSIPLDDFEITAWEVPRGKVGLDYLSVVDKVWELEKQNRVI